MTNPARATLLLVVLAAPAGATLTPYVEVGRDPNQTQAIVMPMPIDFANVPAGAKGVPTESTQTLGDGSTLFRVDDVESDVVHFGSGLLQVFVGAASGHAEVLVRRGSIHAIAVAGAAALPAAYGPGYPGANGPNPYHAAASVSAYGVIYDVIVPPATTSAPNPGDTSTLSIHANLDCGRDPVAADFFSGVFRGSYGIISVGVSTETTYLGGAQQVSDQTGIYHLPCPLFADGTVPVKVGEPIQIAFTVGVLAGARAGGNDGPSETTYFDATNTGTLTIVNEDGVGMVGLSGQDWGTADPGPTVTTTTTTTTTTTFVPPTTLASCSGFCGDAVVQADCAEACECPMTAPDEDSVACNAATSMPALVPSCARCLGCQVNMAFCATTSTTTTTLPACACGDGVWAAGCGEECDCAGAGPCTGAAILPPQQACATCAACALDFSVCTGSTTTTTLAGGTTTTTLPPVCPAAPRDDCRPAASGKAPLVAKNKTADAKDALAWTWTGGALAKGDFGTPSAATAYALCLYDGAALRLAATAPAGSSWKSTRAGFVYKRHDLVPDGLAAVVLKSGAAGKAKLIVKGRGPKLHLPPLPLSTPVRAQLRRVDGGACWNATYGHPSKNQGPVLKAVAD